MIIIDNICSFRYIRILFYSQISNVRWGRPIKRERDRFHIGQREQAQGGIPHDDDKAEPPCGEDIQTLNKL